MTIGGGTEKLLGGGGQVKKIYFQSISTLLNHFGIT